MTYMSCDSRAGRRESAADPTTSTARPRPRASPQAELDQAKSKVRSRLVLSSERPRGRLFTVGGDWVYRREYRPVEQELDAVAAITVDDVLGVLAHYPLTRGTTVTIGPLADVAPPE